MAALRYLAVAESFSYRSALFGRALLWSLPHSLGVFALTCGVLCDPSGFRERPEDFAKVLFIARITEWNEASKMPKG